MYVPTVKMGIGGVLTLVTYDDVVAGFVQVTMGVKTDELAIM